MYSLRKQYILLAGQYYPPAATWHEPETATDEERLKLRAMGYSGDEIDIAL